MKLEQECLDEVDAARWAVSISASTFDEARSRRDLNRLLNYAYYLPRIKGFTQKFVAEHYPGWSFDELQTILKDAGVYVDLNNLGAARCERDVGCVHFNRDGSWRVQWEDGRVTASADRMDKAT